MKLEKLDPTAKHFVECMLDHINQCGLCSKLWQSIEQHRVEIDTIKSISRTNKI